ncbi:PaaI family thioesterase [Geodermatophilus sp. YIM 151500]|uniref:PaaI family thioesterase n=1 Tax=Geodermatophilus sp. YIM 151500 TaxID=2984531 RepID=UPI0021E43144|nr:PaaI family thioesterase [Geodermatophilus sp. YIM 151500]MCV2491164.1 PaaI family thioesterase [Geodermatophilus sp. YIM 151500]
MSDPTPTGPAAPLGLADPVERARAAADDPEHRFGNFFLSRFLSLDISYDDQAQTCSVVLPYAPFLCNPQGTVHGGVITTAMDISMGHLCHRFLSTAVTIEMQLRFFRPLTGTGVIQGRILRAGQRIVHLESHLYDEQHRLAAFATGTWHRLDAVQPSPSQSRPGTAAG